MPANFHTPTRLLHRSPPVHPSRRRLLAGAALAASVLSGGLLSGCGGGSSSETPQAPRIQAFQASTTTTFYVGERPQLTATFSGGTGRIDPDIGPVSSGVAVSVPVLDRSRSYTLTVRAADGSSVARSMDLPVRFRDRYQTLGATLGLQNHAAVGLPDGSLLLIGGTRGQALMSGAIDRWDPETRSLQRVGQLQHARVGPQAVRVVGGPSNGSVLVLGGHVASQDEAEAELFDPVTRAVVTVGTPREPRYEHAMVALPGGRVLVVGGMLRDTVEIWHSATRSFELVAARMRHARAAPSVTLLNDGRVLIAGGLHDGTVTDVPAELFNPETKTFSPVTSVADEMRYGDQAHRLSNGEVLLVGGEVAKPFEAEPADSVLRFNPGTNTLMRDRYLPAPRSRVASVLLPNDELLIFGGRMLGADATPSALSYDRVGMRALFPLPQPRRMHTAHRLFDGRVLILGGSDGDDDPIDSIVIYE